MCASIVWSHLSFVATPTLMEASRALVGARGITAQGVIKIGIDDVHIVRHRARRLRLASGIRWSTPSRPSTILHRHMCSRRPPSSGGDSTLSKPGHTTSAITSRWSTGNRKYRIYIDTRYVNVSINVL